MLLTVTTTHQPATDLGFLLHKHPDRLGEFPLGFGVARVFYPEASAARCTAALLLDVDPVALVRGRPGGGDGPLSSYVNDRPYAASSFLSVAIGKVFRSAMSGRAARPELADAVLPLEVTVAPLRVRGGTDLVARLFGPLGYAVELTPASGDGAAACWTLGLSAETTVARLLTHLYVLIPVLDDEKHYWVAEDELEKLLRHGEGWLAAHPERELMARRYLKRGRHLAGVALERLAALDGDAPEAAAEPAEAPPRPLHEARLHAALDALRASGAARVLDLGCGPGRLLELLLRDARFTKVVGVDLSPRALELARERLDRLPERQRARATLLQSTLTYRDRRLLGYDAAALVEVVEHLDPERLPAFERAVFGAARPGTVVLTTPNREHNARYPGLADGGLRHADHRFEWTRAEFAVWAERVAAEHGYVVALSGIGEADPEVGPPSQMGVFTCAG